MLSAHGARDGRISKSVCTPCVERERGEREEREREERERERREERERRVCVCGGRERGIERRERGCGGGGVCVGGGGREGALAKESMYRYIFTQTQTNHLKVFTCIC